jgi:hypothetical protein
MNLSKKISLCQSVAIMQFTFLTADSKLTKDKIMTFAKGKQPTKAARKQKNPRVDPRVEICHN